ncbi:hypothetical protein ABVT39_005840 [Epinephelus coioides]
MATLDAADSPGKLEQMLNKAYKKIANLLEDIERMSNELQRKDSLLITLRSRFPTLTNWLETSRTGESALQNTTSALGQTVLWDPSSSCQRPACSTPNRGTPWTEVVIRGWKRAPSGAHSRAPSPQIPLSNKYAALSVSEKPATRDSHQETAPVPAATDTMPPPTDTTAFPPLTGSCPPAGGCPAGSRPPVPTRSSSQRKRLVRDVVRWHSSHSPRLARDHTWSPGVGGGSGRSHNPGHRGLYREARPHEGGVNLVVPRSLRYQRNRENTRHPELPSTGEKDYYYHAVPGVFISGPTPTYGRGIGSFSHLLSLNTWLSSACNSHHVGFINNFDVFWERRHLFGPDGLHLNRAGARMLSANLAYGIQHAVFPKPAPAALSNTD